MNHFLGLVVTRNNSYLSIAVYLSLLLLISLLLPLNKSTCCSVRSEQPSKDLTEQDGFPEQACQVHTLRDKPPYFRKSSVSTVLTSSCEAPSQAQSKSCICVCPHTTAPPHI